MHTSTIPTTVLKEAKAKLMVEVIEYLKTRTKKSNKSTILALESKGFSVKFQRFDLSGGVGSYYWLPRKKMWRVQVCAAICGKPQNGKRAKWIGGIPYRSEKKNYYRYAWCLEI